MTSHGFIRLALILLAVLALTAAGLAPAQAFYKEIKLCPNDQNLWVNGLDPNKDTHTAATCVKGEKKVNWSLDVIATQGGGLWGQGFDCAGRDPWTYKNTYHHATNLQYFGQVGCVKIRITQD